MNEKDRRRELVSQFEQTHADAGVYRIVNRRTGRSLIATAVNLAAAQRRFEFASSTNSPSAIDQRLLEDATGPGLAALEFEVLERVETDAQTSPTGLAEDLRILAELWRERFDSARLD